MKKAVAYVLAALLSILFCVGMTLLYRNVREEQALVTCTRLEVSFADTLRFVSEEDIREYLDTRYGTYIGQRLDSVQLSRIEDLLAERSAVQSGQAWTTSDGILHVLVTQRAPVLRIQDGRRSFYVDADGGIFPPHETYIASVPTVEGTIPFEIPDGFRGEAPETATWSSPSTDARSSSSSGSRTTSGTSSSASTATSAPSPLPWRKATTGP